MLRKQARILPKLDTQQVKAYIEKTSKYPQRDFLMFLFSRYCGLRACEISKVTWDMVLDANNTVGDHLYFRSASSKGGYGGGVIPLHPEIKSVLESVEIKDGYIIGSQRGSKLAPNSIVNFFQILYKGLGLHGCSSHSGRRTFITMAARGMKQAGASVRDVMDLSRHSNLSSLQLYIQGDPEVQKTLVFSQ